MMRILFFGVLLFLAYMFFSDVMSQIAGDFHQVFQWMFP
jgi:hypothetical protein